MKEFSEDLEVYKRGALEDLLYERGLSQLGARDPTDAYDGSAGLLTRRCFGLGRPCYPFGTAINEVTTCVRDARARREDRRLKENRPESAEQGSPQSVKQASPHQSKSS